MHMLRLCYRHRVSAAGLLAASVAFAIGTYAQPASAQGAQPQASDANVTPLLAKPLVGIEGKEVSMSVVEYAPGGASPPHRHNANVFVYVLEGSVVMQVEGGEEVTLTAGQTFYETPSDIHAVSRNASETEPAKILAFLVKDEGAPATIPAE